MCNILLFYLIKMECEWRGSLWMTAGSKGQSFKVRRSCGGLLLHTSSNVPNDTNRALNVLVFLFVCFLFCFFQMLVPVPALISLTVKSISCGFGWNMQREASRGESCSCCTLKPWSKMNILDPYISHHRHTLHNCLFMCHALNVCLIAQFWKK